MRIIFKLYSPKGPKSNDIPASLSTANENESFLEKWPIPGLEQEKHKISLKYSIPEFRAESKNL